mgnify:CR=1 FL=1
MAEEEVESILKTIESVLSMLISFLKRVKPDEIKRFPVDEQLTFFAGEILRYANIKLSGKIEIGKEVVLHDYEKAQRRTEVIPIKWLYEIKRRTRLHIQLNAKTSSYKHQIIATFYVKENGRIKREEFWMDVIPVKGFTNRVKENLKELERYGKRIASYVLARILEELIKRSRQGMPS